MRTNRRGGPLLPVRAIVLATLLAAIAGVSSTPSGAAAGRCFTETGQCIQGRFLAYWDEHGGLARNGYPLTGEQTEILEDGRSYTVQYFERARLEYHPENAAPNDVLLGQFGRRMLGAAYAEIHDYREYQRVTAPVAGSGPFYFAATGHNIAPRFQEYWAQNGGLAQFGYPLTEERYDSLQAPGGQTCCVTQYFERARFEWHPENAGTPYVILLGQFGRTILADNARLGGDFRPLYFGNNDLRERLGAPRGPLTTSPGAALSFQRGLMLWRGDGRQIYVLAADGRVLTQSVFRPYFDDSWKEGDPIGGGPARTEPNKFVPQRGFFTVWRENMPVFETLGYANVPNETGYTMRVQEFAGGLLLTGEEGGVRTTYAIFIQRTGNSGAPIVTWSRIFTETVGGTR